MKTISIKIEGAEVEQKFVDFAKVLEIIKKEDENLMKNYKIYKDNDPEVANICLERAIETDIIVKKLHKTFGNEFD